MNVGAILLLTRCVILFLSHQNSNFIHVQHYLQIFSCTADNLAQVPLPSHSDAAPAAPGGNVELDLKCPISGPDSQVTTTFSGRKYIVLDYGHCYLLRSR